MLHLTKDFIELPVSLVTLNDDYKLLCNLIIARWFCRLHCIKIVQLTLKLQTNSKKNAAKDGEIYQKHFNVKLKYEQAT